MNPWLVFLGAYAVASNQAQRHIADLAQFDVERARSALLDLGMSAEDDPRWHEWSRTVLAQSLAKYPALPTAVRLDAVHIVHLLWWEKSYYGGMPTSNYRGIVLSVGAPNVDAPWMERAFHHEFAHILQYKAGRNFPRKAWIAANAPQFRYASRDAGGGSYAAIKNGKSSKTFDPSLNEQGILHEYGAATFEEDWACYAENILADDAGFWELAAKYPRVAEKARVLSAFYRKTLPGIRLRDF